MTDFAFRHDNIREAYERARRLSEDNKGKEYVYVHMNSPKDFEVSNRGREKRYMAKFRGGSRITY